MQNVDSTICKLPSNFQTFDFPETHRIEISNLRIFVPVTFTEDEITDKRVTTTT